MRQATNGNWLSSEIMGLACPKAGTGDSRVTLLADKEPLKTAR